MLSCDIATIFSKCLVLQVEFALLEISCKLLRIYVELVQQLLYYSPSILPNVISYERVLLDYTLDIYFSIWHGNPQKKEYLNLTPQVSKRELK